MKSQDNAEKIINLIKSNQGLEVKQICHLLNITPFQFQGAKPFITNDCFRLTKKWYRK